MTLSKNKWPYLDVVDPKIYQQDISWPKISIVTPSYNQGQFIEETILSVLNQNYPNLEYVIIDGGSTDDTISIIKKYEQQLNYWTSEKDRGQADAINKGLQVCTGAIFNWINSDDLLAKGALLTVAKEYIKNPNLKVIAGGCCAFDNSLPETYSYTKQDLTFNGLISEKSNFQQPSQWLNIERYTIEMNSELHYSFDWELILNLNINISEISYINILLSYFRLHSLSKTNNFGLEFKVEKLMIVKNYYKRYKTNFWTLKRYHTFLNAYVQTCLAKQTDSNLFLLLLKNPTLIFSRFYLSNLLKGLLKTDK